MFSTVAEALVSTRCWSQGGGLRRRRGGGGGALGRGGQLGSGGWGVAGDCIRALLVKMFICRGRRIYRRRRSWFGGVKPVGETSRLSWVCGRFVGEGGRMVSKGVTGGERSRFDVWETT